MVHSEDLIKETIERITKLRLNKDVSAREMSLSMGQGRSYINNIENGSAKPSLEGLFLICEYMNITPKEFFDTHNSYPEELSNLIENLKKLPRDHLESISKIVEGLVK